MPSVNDICTLDYLVGTLSTAYKGNITSLVVKDFCMSEEGNTVQLKGHILSLPAGDYEASLIQAGIELARSGLKAGSFILKTESERVKQAKDLQIDIIQTGRHIGTFLLKKKNTDGFYMSAIDLSGELKGIDFKLLTNPLRNKIGLLRKAESIITTILSSKKDWPDFSEKLNSFAEDLFWADKKAFIEAFRIVAHFLLKAAERANLSVTTKPIGNFLGCLELPLLKDNDDNRVRRAVDVWLSELKSATIDLSAHLRRSSDILHSIHARFPDADIASSLERLLTSLRMKLSSVAALDADLLKGLGSFISSDEKSLLARHDTKAREELLQRISAAERDLRKGEHKKVFTFLGSLETDRLDDEKMTAAFFETLATNLHAGSADAFYSVLQSLFALFPVLSVRALENSKSNIPATMVKLISINRTDLCEELLARVAATGSPFKEEILMNPGIAGAFLDSDRTDLITHYGEILTEIVIPPPGIKELSTETWAEIVNPLHLERLGKFIEILELGNDRFRTVLAHIIANLYVSGVFIPDDRLYHRKVSAYLNSPAMEGHFLLTYLLLKKLPVYYNEVGAVSRIRDYSTEIDSWGNDPVLYFLRKQVHVNASNYNVRLIEKIMSSWVFNAPSILKDVIPPDVYSGLKPELFSRYSAAIGPFFESLGVLDNHGFHFEKLLRIPEEQFRVATGEEIPGKIVLLCRLYQEIVKKYSYGGAGNRWNDAASLVDYLDKAKKAVQTIRKPEKTEAREELYFKRHIAFGIPSVLGTYHEQKFDALGELLRLDEGVAQPLEEAASEIEAKGLNLTASEAASWLAVLAASYEILKLHGLENTQIEELIQIMRQNQLRLSQAADLLKMWQKELAWMVRFFNHTFHKALTDLLKKMPLDSLPDHLMHLDRSNQDYPDKAADIIIRDMIADVPALMESDRIIEKLLKSFLACVEKNADGKINKHLPGEEREYFPIQELSDKEAAQLAPCLGGKAKNLVYLHNRGFRVPAGVVLSAGLTRAFSPGDAGRNIDALLLQAVQCVERASGKAFGSAENPLFLSVRSGSYVSMPGILSTVLYCGMNDKTLEGLAKSTGNRQLALDSYRRFIEQYGTAVLGIKMQTFDRIRSEVLKTAAVSQEARDQQLQLLVQLYLQEVLLRKKQIPSDVYEQLSRSVKAIYASWYGERAVQFRRVTKASEKWGTSVTLMQMVYGNAVGSGASVFFTSNPLTQEQEIFGETREAATGDDLVYGKHLNRPLSRKQIALGTAEDRLRRGELLRKSLEEKDPGLFALHEKLGREVEQAMGGLPQEVEATYTQELNGRRTLFVLQARRMELSVDHADKFDEICQMESRIIGRGFGAYGGALSGVASFAASAEQAVRLGKERGMPVILLRRTANTEDVSLMPFIRGIITASGGVTSHASVLAQKFGIHAVLACSDLVIKTDDQGSAYAMIGQTTVREGSLISIDASSGLVFSGSCFSISKAAA